MDLPTLNPCPFCGGSAEYRNEFGYHENPKDFTVENGTIIWGVYLQCNSCECQLGNDGMNSQECCVGEYSTFEEAAMAWNHRA